MKLKGKIVSRAASFFVAAAAMLFASCANQLSGGYVSDSDGKSKTLNIAVTNYSELASGSSRSLASSRTIMPDSYDSDGVDLYIYGVATNGTEFNAPAKVEFEGNTDAGTGSVSKTVGKIKIDAEAAVWEFTLAAVAKNDVPATLDEMKEKAVLIGYASLDMTYGDTAKFTLSPDGLTKEASVAMKLYNDGWTTPDGYTIKAGIYKLTDGADATDKGDGSGNATAQDIASLETSEPAAANYSLASMAPGTYLFKVTYTSDATKKSFVWSDTLIVLPGKPVDNSIAIPNVIAKCLLLRQISRQAMKRTVKMKESVIIQLILNGLAALKTSFPTSLKFYILRTLQLQPPFQQAMMNGLLRQLLRELKLILLTQNSLHPIFMAQVLS